MLAEEVVEKKWLLASVSTVPPVLQLYYKMFLGHWVFLAIVGTRAIPVTSAILKSLKNYVKLQRLIIEQLDVVVFAAILLMILAGPGSGI